MRNGRCRKGPGCGRKRGEKCALGRNWPLSQTFFASLSRNTFLSPSEAKPLLVAEPRRRRRDKDDDDRAHGRAPAPSPGPGLGGRRGSAEERRGQRGERWRRCPKATTTATTTTTTDGVCPSLRLPPSPSLARTCARARRRACDCAHRRRTGIRTHLEGERVAAVSLLLIFFSSLFLVRLSFDRRPTLPSSPCACQTDPLSSRRAWRTCILSFAGPSPGLRCSVRDKKSQEEKRARARKRAKRVGPLPKT